MATNNQFKIGSDLSEVKVLASHFRDFCNENHIDEQAYSLIELALVEALNNIIIHAYDRQPGLEILAKYEFIDSVIIITLTDFGKAFTKKETNNESDTEDSNVDELPEGNWGIDLIGSITDEIIRYRKEDTNTLILKKNITT